MQHKMPRILKHLVINEVSAVIRSANSGAKVLIRKADDDTPQHRPLLFNDFMKAATAQSMHDKKRRAAERLMTELSEDEKETQTSRTQKEEPQMNRLDELKDIAKADGGMAMIAKNIIDKGSTTITEHEFSAALMEYAKIEAGKTGKSKFTIFAKLYEDPDNEFCKAVNIIKGYPDVMNVSVSSVEVGGTVTADDSKKAYDQLMAMARRQHETSPAKTVEQCFEIVMQQNPDLAAKAHRRPDVSSPSYDAEINKTAGRDLIPTALIIDCCPCSGGD
jgi:hypothetical protein